MNKQAILNAINNGHLGLLKSYLEGADIEASVEKGERWWPVPEPMFHGLQNYRIAPRKTEISRLTTENSHILNAINNGHLAVLKAHLEGKTIQIKAVKSKEWKETKEPEFYGYYFYRVKPEDPNNLIIYIHRHMDTGNLMSSMYSDDTGPWKLIDTLIYKEEKDNG